MSSTEIEFSLIKHIFLASLGLISFDKSSQQRLTFPDSVVIEVIFQCVTMSAYQLMKIVFVPEAEDFLFPLADLVEIISISDLTTDNPIEPQHIPFAVMKVILSRKCSELIVEDTELPLEEAEKFVQVQKIF